MTDPGKNFNKHRVESVFRYKKILNYNIYNNIVYIIIQLSNRCCQKFKFVKYLNNYIKQVSSLETACKIFKVGNI